MNRPSRLARLVLLWVLVAAPAAAAPSSIALFEKVRPIEGRPSEMIVSLKLHDALFAALLGVTIEGEGVHSAVVVTVEAEPLGLSLDDAVAFEIPLPPLVGGYHDVILRKKVGGGPAVEEARDIFVVHPPIVVALEEDGAGTGSYRLHVSGRSAGARFNGPPSVEGGKIRVPIQLFCYFECVADPVIVFDWDIRSEPLGSLLAGSRYELELVEDPVPAGRARVAWRETVLVESPRTLLRDGAFAIEVELAAPHPETPRLVMPVSADSALYSFFSPNNWELMVKVLDGCAINGFFWVYAAASTDVGYTLRVTDRNGIGGTKEYVFPGGAPAPALTDGEAFPCDCPVCGG